MSVNTTGTDIQGQAAPTVDVTGSETQRKAADAPCDPAGRTTNGTTVISVTQAVQTLKDAGYRQQERVLVLDGRRQPRTVLIAPEGGK